MTDNVSVKFNDKAFLAAMQKAPETVANEVTGAVERTAKEVAAKMKAAAPKAMSTLTDSIKEDKITPLRYRVSPHVNYAEYVEKGTKPGYFPNLGALSDWVRTKLHIREPKERLRVAEKIMWSINQRGTKPQPFVQPLVDSGWPQQRLNFLANKGVRNGLKRAGF